MYQAIKIEDYWTIYSEPPIKENDWLVDIITKEVYKAKVDSDTAIKGVYKVIACSKELNGLPVFVPEWEKLESVRVADDLFEIDKIEDWSEKKEALRDKFNFEVGYNTAKEKYRFTEEDIVHAYECGWNEGMTYNDDEENPVPKSVMFLESFIKFKNQPKQYTVEIENVSDNEVKIISWKEM